MIRNSNQPRARKNPPADIWKEIDKLLFIDNPSPLGNQIAKDLNDYTVAFVRSKNRKLEAAGSGTLVSFRNSFYVLTAAHVWHGDKPSNGLKNADQILIPLKEKQNTRLIIAPDEIETVGPKIRRKWNKWGPDVTMLRLPPERVGSIKAVGRSFYNLSQKKEINVGSVETFFLMGAPEERGDYTPDRAIPEVQAMLLWEATGPYLSLRLPRYLRQHIDYLDLRINNTVPGVAKRFGGVSGGGLWKVYVYPLKGGGYDSVKILAGVAYWEKPLGRGRGLLVRCHGPQTIGTVLREVPK